MDTLRNIGRVLSAPFRFINTYFKVIVFLFIVFLILSAGGEKEAGEPPNLAKLYLTTPIFESESFAAQIEHIKKNKSIKGVLLIIDSPGGAVSASIEIADMIKELGEQLPIIAYVRGAMASGSYYAGMYASEVYANRGALVGSIGVIFSGVNIAQLLEKLGIKEQGVKAGAYKEVGTINRAWSEQEKAYLENLIHEQYAMFYTDVLKARDSKLKSKDYHEFAEGKIFSARSALELGLIDHIGTMNEAIKALQERAQVKEPVWLKKDKFEAYMERLLDGASSKILSLAAPTLRAEL